jgi:hypothetical protein
LITVVLSGYLKLEGVVVSQRCSKVLLVPILVACLLVAGATSAEAHFSSSDFSHASGSGCAHKVDPVTIVFLGFSAYADTHGHSWRTWDLINGMPDPDHDWANTNASTQLASSHSVCTEMERQSATGCGTCTRYHIRLNQTHHPDLNGRYETVGTAHYEIDAGCGHVVPYNGFDLGRGHVKNDWLSAYGSGKLWKTENWGNSDMIRQCDGQFSGSSGQVYWLTTD